MRSLQLKEATAFKGSHATAASNAAILVGMSSEADLAKVHEGVLAEANSRSAEQLKTANEELAASRRATEAAERAAAEATRRAEAADAAALAANAEADAQERVFADARVRILRRYEETKRFLEAQQELDEIDIANAMAVAPNVEPPA